MDISRIFQKRSLIVLLLAVLVVGSVSAEKYRFVTLEYPPYEYTENGQVTGLVVELLRETFRQMGHELTIEVYPWARSIDLFKNGEADGIFTFFRTPEREEFTHFSSEAIVSQPITLWVMKDSPIQFDGNLAKLKDHSFGVVRGTSYGTIFDTAAKNKTFKVTEGSAINQCIEMLANKRFDIWISNRFGAVYELKKAGKYADVRELNPPIEETLAFVGFSKKKNLSALRDQFDVALRKLKKSSWYDSTIKKYMK